MPFGTALVAADLAVARAGGSVFELAQYGRLAEMAAASRRLARTDAAAVVAREVLAAAR